MHDLLQPSQCDALLTGFQTVQRRGRQPKLSGELREGHVAALLAKERSELSFELL